MPSRHDINEGPSEKDLQDLGGLTRPCPSCGTHVYDDADWCYKCGSVLDGAGDSAENPEGKRLGLLLVVGLMIAAFLLALLVR